MKRLTSILLALLIITVLCVFSAYAQLSGPLSGTITAGNYTVIGEISVEAGDSLTLEPGVVFEFNGNYEFDINGYLYAVGTETDSIKFMTNAGVSYWKGINFNDSADDYSRLEYCLITGSSYSGIRCWQSSPSIANCTISGNTVFSGGGSSGGGGIQCNNSSPVIENCTISGNTATGDYSSGGGISCGNNSSPTIANCSISENSADYSGGGIYCGYYSSPTIDSCTISENTADYSGGGISCWYNSIPVIENCTICGNIANGFGGGIWCDDTSLTISNCAISGNTANANGGGISCGYYSSPAIANCDISGNTAAYFGGGISCGYYSIPVIENCTICGNIANGFGGGIWCDDTSPTISNCAISGNTAGSDGGGISCWDSSPTISNCAISGNTAVDDGGGIYCHSYSSPAIENCTISGNSADDDGGGIYCTESSPTIENCTISGNTAGDDGGGIYCREYSDPTGVNNIIWANSAPTGSQIYLYSGSSSFTCTYSDIQDGWGGVGNIDVDPLFVDPLNSDFHLQSASPCIDAGNPDPQYNDPEDPANPGFALYPAMGTIVNDMGAYGGQGVLGWVGVSEKPAIKKYPESYMLFQNYPNPFNPKTAISYQLQAASYVELTVYDIAGREVASLVNGYMSSGCRAGSILPG